MVDDSLAVVVGAIRGLVVGDVVVVALDGFSGSGKSTLARRLVERLGGVVVEDDDFYRVMDDAVRWDLDPSAGVDLYFDWERLRDEALVPLRGGMAASYSPYDWSAGGGLCPRPVTVGPASVIVVDGVYSARPELSALVDVAVLVSTRQHVRDERVSHRDHGNDRWHSRWAAAEQHYFANVRPAESFDLVVDGE